MENSRHSFLTRLFHMALATAVIVQVLSSLLMTAPLEDRQEDWLFEVHEFSGITALFLVAGFWLVVALRRRGTPVAILFPWFSATGRRALWEDLVDHWQHIKRLGLPDFRAESPLACAVHGLGLLLVTAMAASGALFFLAMILEAKTSLWATIDIEVHQVLANLVWAYLIGHAGLAVIQHHLKNMRLSEMWSLRK